MLENRLELLNGIYKEISDVTNIDIAFKIYELYKGQQICFPVRFFSPTSVKQIIREEYDGKNIRVLAKKYNYSEKTIRRIVSKVKI
ncbi:MAG: Mor transcription activator family protein [Oscillospiraceae bacterium]